MDRQQKFKDYLKCVNEIRNQTPHDVTVLSDAVSVIYEKCSDPIRVSELITEVGMYADTTVVNIVSYTDAELPVFEEGVLNIVSLPVAQYVKNSTQRVDFVTPGELVRNSEGVIIGCRTLSFVD